MISIRIRWSSLIDQLSKLFHGQIFVCCYSFLVYSLLIINKQQYEGQKLFPSREYFVTRRWDNSESLIKQLLGYFHFLVLDVVMFDITDFCAWKCCDRVHICSVIIKNNRKSIVVPPVKMWWKCNFNFSSISSIRPDVEFLAVTDSTVSFIAASRPSVHVTMPVSHFTFVTRNSL